MKPVTVLTISLFASSPGLPLLAAESIASALTDRPIDESSPQQPPGSADTATNTPQPRTASAQNADPGGQKPEDPLSKFKFGAAIGVSIAQGALPVGDAQVVAGLVRVNQTSRAVPRVLLEIHRPIVLTKREPRLVRYRVPKALASEQDKEATPNGPFYRTETIERAGWGFGPFAAVQSGGKNAIDGFAAGVMFSILRDTDTGNDFNIGLGMMLDSKVKRLGDGIVSNQALPQGETAVRFKEESRWSFVILFSLGGR